LVESVLSAKGFLNRLFFLLIYFVTVYVRGIFLVAYFLLLLCGLAGLLLTFEVVGVSPISFGLPPVSFSVSNSDPGFYENAALFVSALFLVVGFVASAVSKAFLHRDFSREQKRSLVFKILFWTPVADYFLLLPSIFARSENFGAALLLSLFIWPFLLCLFSGVSIGFFLASEFLASIQPSE
jgi:hypothetical protein